MTEKSEQEIIEEIMKDSFQGCNGIMKPECKLNYRTMRKCGDAFYCVNCMYHSIEKTLQKGKELGKDSKCRDWKFVVNVREKTIKDQASKIAELQALNDHLTNANREHNKRIAELEKDLQNYQNFKDEITKLKEERKQLVDELEENLNIIKSDDCIYRDNPRLPRQIKSLETIIKVLRGEK